jgi:hypothetical protein
MLPVLPAEVAATPFRFPSLRTKLGRIAQSDLGNKCRGGCCHSGSLPESHVGAHGSACGTVVQVDLRRMSLQTVAWATIVLQGPFEWQRRRRQSWLETLVYAPET